MGVDTVVDDGELGLTTTMGASAGGPAGVEGAEVGVLGVELGATGTRVLAGSVGGCGPVTGGLGGGGAVAGPITGEVLVVGSPGPSVIGCSWLVRDCASARTLSGAAEIPPRVGARG